MNMGMEDLIRTTADRMGVRLTKDQLDTITARCQGCPEDDAVRLGINEISKVLIDNFPEGQCYIFPTQSGGIQSEGRIVSLPVAELADWLHDRKSVWKALAMFRAFPLCGAGRCFPVRFIGGSWHG